MRRDTGSAVIGRRALRLGATLVVVLGACGGEPDPASSPPDSEPQPGADGGADPSAPPPAAPVSAPAGGAADGIAVAFKLDDRLTDGLYMGERWVSPPVFGPLDGSEPVQAMARCLAPVGGGEAAEWSTLTPAVVTVAASRPGEVTLRVVGAGEGALVVACGARFRELRVSAAVDARGVLRVRIAQ